MAGKGSAKRRLDQLLVDRGLVENRTRAQALVLAGLVYSETRRLDKAGQQLPEETALSVKGREHPWVSRGGVKLAHGLRHFGIDPSEKICIDVGASTGGFTDVLLTGGAARVFAVDVGRGQLAWKLRQDERVVILERTNARDLTPVLVPEPIDLIVSDVSFISLEKALPASLALAVPGAELVALIKPQFEAGKHAVGKGGVVRDPEVRRQVCERIETWLATQPGWRVLGVDESPITGPEGNVEYLIAARKEQEPLV